MTFSEARETVVRALDTAANVLNDADLGTALRDPALDVRFAELKLDSLATIECCLVLEDDTMIEIDPADLAIHDSVNRLAEFIAQRTSTA
jgi:acyl carrier protein